jgi:hypothetical protein
MAISIFLSRPNCGGKQRMVRPIEISNENSVIASAKTIAPRRLLLTSSKGLLEILDKPEAELFIVISL